MQVHGVGLEPTRMHGNHDSHRGDDGWPRELALIAPAAVATAATLTGSTSSTSGISRHGSSRMLGQNVACGEQGHVV